MEDSYHKFKRALIAKGLEHLREMEDMSEQQIKNYVHDIMDAAIVVGVYPDATQRDLFGLIVVQGERMLMQEFARQGTPLPVEFGVLPYPDRDSAEKAAKNGRRQQMN